MPVLNHNSTIHQRKLKNNFCYEGPQESGGVPRGGLVRRVLAAAPPRAPVALLRGLPRAAAEDAPKAALVTRLKKPEKTDFEYAQKSKKKSEKSIFSSLRPGRPLPR